MRITKKQSLLLAVCIIGLFFAGAIVLIRRQNAGAPSVEQQTRKTEKVVAEIAKSLRAVSGVDIESGAVVMGSFQRSESKNGKKLWEISANQGSYSPLRGEAVLSNPFLTFYQKTGESVSLKSEKAEVFLDGQNLQRADLSGTVTGERSDGLRLEAPSASWDKAVNVVTADGPVKLTSTKAVIKGRKVRVNLDEKTIFVGSDVFTEIKPFKAD